MAAQVRFLSVDDALAIHENTIAHEGGSPGILNLGLLESAVTMPQQQFGGRMLHEDLAAMAAAYLFHLAQNHPFEDGNRRTAVLALLVFLDINGVDRPPGPEKLETATLAVASGQMNKTECTEWLRAEMT